MVTILRSILQKNKICQMDDLFTGPNNNKYYYSPKNVTRNVSSIELQKLLCANGSTVCSKKKNKYKEYGHYWQRYAKGDIVIQTCQNKGCMCKPIIDGKPRCQSQNKQTQSGNEILYNPSRESQMRRSRAQSIIKTYEQDGTHEQQHSIHNQSGIEVDPLEVKNKESNYNISIDREILNNNHNGIHNEHLEVLNGNHRTYKPCMCCKSFINGKQRCPCQNIQTKYGKEMFYNPSKESQMRRSRGDSIIKMQDKDDMRERQQSIHEQNAIEVDSSEVKNKDSDYNTNIEHEILSNNHNGKQTDNNEIRNNHNGIYNECCCKPRCPCQNKLTKSGNEVLYNPSKEIQVRRSRGHSIIKTAEQDGMRERQHSIREQNGIEVNSSEVKNKESDYNTNIEHEILSNNHNGKQTDNNEIYNNHNGIYNECCCKPRCPCHNKLTKSGNEVLYNPSKESQVRRSRGHSIIKTAEQDGMRERQHSIREQNGIEVNSSEVKNKESDYNTNIEHEILSNNHNGKQTDYNEIHNNHNGIHECCCKPRCPCQNKLTKSGNDMFYNPSKESEMRRSRAHSIIKTQENNIHEQRHSRHEQNGVYEILNNNHNGNQTDYNTDNNHNEINNEHHEVLNGNHRTYNVPYRGSIEDKEIYNNNNGAHNDQNEVQSYRSPYDTNEIPGDHHESRNNGGKTLEFPMCKPNPCNPCPDDLRYCVPSNFDRLIQEAGDREIKYIECKNRDRCTCDKLEVQEDLMTRLKLPGKICVQSLEQPSWNDKPSPPPKKKSIEEDIEEEHVEKEITEEYITEPESPPSKKKSIEEDIEDEHVEKEHIMEPKSSSSNQTSCFCFKKKSKKCCEKCIQTGGCCTNKIIQKEEESACCFCPVKGHDEANVDVEPTRDKVKSIWICSRCGKLYNSTCKRCEKSCAKNTFIIPPTGALTGDQTETLRTLIKLEAKQNYRQIDNILVELNEQRNEIKKLRELCNCNYISNDVNPNGSIKSDKINGLHDTQNVYICEGCEIDINRNILKTIKTRDKRKRMDDDIYDIVNWADSYQKAENDKYLKNITNRRTCCPINPKKNQTEDGKYVRHDFTKLKRTNKENEIKKQKKKKSFFDMDSDDKSQTDSVDNLNIGTRTGTSLEKNKIEAEKPYIEELNKTDSDTQSNKCSFTTWWKKSITSLKQKKNKDILKQRKPLSSLQEKPSKNTTKYHNREELNEKKGSKFTKNNNEGKLPCEKYLWNKIVQCKIKDKEVKTKRSFMRSCAKYCK